MEKVLVIGENSFIGKHLNKFDRISYRNLDEVNFKDYDVVVNCALNPLYKTDEYSEDIDIDLKVGVMACQANCHYVMLSTSKVYGTSHDLKTFNEFSTTNPDDNYGKNKLITEFKLLANFPNQITILRGSNIFGFEYGRNSFMGYCMSQLVNEGVVKLTIAPLTKRDFLPVEVAAKLIEKVCEVKPKGVYNLSSGIGLEIGKIIDYLIDGYGYDAKRRQVDLKHDRQFILDNSKLLKALNTEMEVIDYGKIFYYLGKRLCKI